MPPYKRQHYLPAAYLKFFSADAAVSGRKSPIWRIDQKSQRLVPAESQCEADYHYSRDKAAETERMLQNIEGRYTQCIESLVARRHITQEQYGDLVLSMFDFYIRNGIHQNATEQE